MRRSRSPNRAVGSGAHESLIYRMNSMLGLRNSMALSRPLEGFILHPKLAYSAAVQISPALMQTSPWEKKLLFASDNHRVIFSRSTRAARLFWHGSFHLHRKRLLALQPVFGSPIAARSSARASSFHALALISQSHPAMSFGTHRATQGVHFTDWASASIITTRRDNARANRDAISGERDRALGNVPCLRNGSSSRPTLGWAIRWKP